MNELFTRVSVRDFIPGKVEKDKVDRILEAAMNAPSARNQQAWEFIVVDDPDYIRELSKVTPYAGPVGKAPLAIVVLGNRDLMSAPQFWEQDLGACTENLMLSATSLGRPCQGEDERDLRHLRPHGEPHALLHRRRGLPEG